MAGFYSFDPIVLLYEKVNFKIGSLFIVNVKTKLKSLSLDNSFIIFRKQTVIKT